MDADTERRLISALGTLAMVKGCAENAGGLTVAQEHEVNEAMKHLGNILLEEEQTRRESGRVHRLQARSYRPRQWGCA